MSLEPRTDVVFICSIIVKSLYFEINWQVVKKARFKASFHILGLGLEEEASMRNYDYERVN